MQSLQASDLAIRLMLWLHELHHPRNHWVTSLTSYHSVVKLNCSDPITINCTDAPMITQFGPNPTNATENQQTQFECYGNGKPSPTFYIEKVMAAPGRI